MSQLFCKDRQHGWKDNELLLFDIYLLLRLSRGERVDVNLSSKSNVYSAVSGMLIENTCIIPYHFATLHKKHI